MIEISVVLRKIATSSRSLPYVIINSEPILAVMKSSAIAISGEKITGKSTGRRIVSLME